jgi:hypothetical protein
MKHWLSLANVAEVDQYIEIARFAEEIGYHGLPVPKRPTLTHRTAKPGGLMTCPGRIPM